MRLIPLEIGRLESDLSFLMGRPGRAKLPIASWLIEHPEGLILFDTGLHRDLQHDATRLGANASMFTADFLPGEELTARLAAHSVRPSDITHMIFSHLHFDHAGGTEEIPDARILVQESEWTAGHHPKLVERGVYDPNDFDHGHELELLDGRHDVFGDGRVLCLPTPGHTIGHQALEVVLDSGPVILTGDCVYFESLLDDMRTPAFGWNTDEQLRSMEMLAARRADGTRLLFGHDEAQFRSLPSAGLT